MIKTFWNKIDTTQICHKCQEKMSSNICIVSYAMLIWDRKGKTFVSFFTSDAHEKKRKMIPNEK